MNIFNHLHTTASTPLTPSSCRLFLDLPYFFD